MCRCGYSDSRSEVDWQSGTRDPRSQQIGENRKGNLSRGWSAKASLITFDVLLLGKEFKEKGAGRQWIKAGKKVGKLGGKTGK